MENSNKRNITLSIKVTAEQKAEFAKIAAKHNISLSEWSASLLEIYKDSYDKIGDPTLREIALEMEIQKKEREIKRLKAHLESADHKVQVEMDRADKAISRRDNEILKNKQLRITNQKIEEELENKNIERKEQNSIKLNPSTIPIAAASMLVGLMMSKK